MNSLVLSVIVGLLQIAAIISIVGLSYNYGVLKNAPDKEIKKIKKNQRVFLYLTFVFYLFYKILKTQIT